MLTESIISVLLSIVLGILSSICGFDVFQSVSTTLLVFLCSELIILIWKIGKIKYYQQEENNFLKHVNPYSQKLESINKFYYNILKNKHGNNDLFVVTCSKAIDNLYILTKQADIENKIRISSDYLINVRGVFDALNATDDKTVKLTFPISKIESSIISGSEDRKFFETIYKKIANKEVNKLQILIILDEEELINNEQIQALFKFYASNKNYYCKYILKNDFLSACENNMIPKTSLDFGIYGSKMLFVVENQIPYEGVYYKDELIIATYDKMFDEIWNFESITNDNPIEIENKTGMSPKQFFELTNKCG